MRKGKEAESEVFVAILFPVFTAEGMGWGYALQELNGRRFLPILTSMRQIEAIDLSAGNALRHKEAGGEERVLLSEVTESGEYRAQLVVSGCSEDTLRLRPSDAIAYAMENGVRMFVREELFTHYEENATEANKAYIGDMLLSAHPLCTDQ